MDTYEKKYKEALERAKKFIEANSLVQNLNTWIKETFPELAESEDEKIRKTIIRFFKDQYSNETEMYDGSVTVGKAIVWLEKQGEQKPAVEMKTPEESLGIDSETYNKIVDECIYGEQKSQRMISAEAKEAMYDKPAWSEKDEKEYKYVLKFVDNILNNCGNKKDYEHCKRCYDWLKSIKQRIK